MSRRADDDDGYQAWFERTWRDREVALQERYGPSQPAGSPPGHVSALPMALRMERPGLCVQTFRPVDGDARRRARASWAYVTHGLTHPIDDASEPPGAWELAVETPADWPLAPSLLQLLASEEIEGAGFGVGHRVAAFVERRGDDLVPYLGAPDQHPGVSADGAIRWLLLWPHLRPFGRFACETGWTGVLVGTGLTHDEFDLLDEVDRCGHHLQLLLCERGVGQVTDLARASVLDDAEGRRAWSRIRALSPEEAYGEVVRRFAIAHGDERWPFEAPKNQATITLRSVLDGADILHVCHDDDGGWQMLDGGDVREADARVVSLAKMIELDPTLRELAHLPPTWRATRERRGAPWRWSAGG